MTDYRHCSLTEFIFILNKNRSLSLPKTEYIDNINIEIVNDSKNKYYNLIDTKMKTNAYIQHNTEKEIYIKESTDSIDDMKFNIYIPLAIIMVKNDCYEGFLHIMQCFWKHLFTLQYRHMCSFYIMWQYIVYYKRDNIATRLLKKIVIFKNVSFYLDNRHCITHNSSCDFYLPKTIKVSLVDIISYIKSLNIKLTRLNMDDIFESCQHYKLRTNMEGLKWLYDNDYIYTSKKYIELEQNNNFSTGQDIYKFIIFYSNLSNVDLTSLLNKTEKYTYDAPLQIIKLLYNKKCPTDNCCLQYYYMQYHSYLGKRNSWYSKAFPKHAFILPVLYQFLYKTHKPNKIYDVIKKQAKCGVFCYIKYMSKKIKNNNNSCH